MRILISRFELEKGEKAKKKKKKKKKKKRERFATFIGEISLK